MDEVSIENARRTLGEIVDKARLAGHPTRITRQGKPAAMVVPVRWYEWLKELDAAAASESPQDKPAAIPILVDEDMPASQEEIREVATRILENSPSGDATLLAQLVLSWLDWAPGGWTTPDTPDHEGERDR